MVAYENRSPILLIIKLVIFSENNYVFYMKSINRSVKAIAY